MSAAPEAGAALEPLRAQPHILAVQQEACDGPTQFARRGVRRCGGDGSWRRSEGEVLRDDQPAVGEDGGALEYVA